jgi:hypothetical protein
VKKKSSPFLRIAILLDECWTVCHGTIVWAWPQKIKKFSPKKLVPNFKTNLQKISTILSQKNKQTRCLILYIKHCTQLELWV